LVFSADGKLLAGAGYGEPQIWDVANGTTIGRFDGPSGGVLAMRLTESSLVTVGQYGRVCEHDLETGRIIGESKRPKDEPHVARVRLFRDGRRMLACAGYELQVREVRGGRLLWRANCGGAVTALAVSHDGTRVAAASGYTEGLDVVLDDGIVRVRVFDTEGGRVLHTIGVYKRSVRAMEFSPDGKLLAIASRDGTVRIWGVGTWRQLVRLTGHTQPVASLAFAPDGRTLATGSEDTTVLIWSVDQILRGDSGPPRARRPDIE
jgi:WD40 repeat protein